MFSRKLLAACVLNSTVLVERCPIMMFRTNHQQRDHPARSKQPESFGGRSTELGGCHRRLSRNQLHHHFQGEEGGRGVQSHLYVQRRLHPLDVYLEVLIRETSATGVELSILALVLMLVIHYTHCLLFIT